MDTLHQPQNQEHYFIVTSLPEWHLLSGDDVVSTPESIQHEVDNDAEMKRTLCSLNCLQYIYDGGVNNYNKLTEAQDQAIRLSPEQFEEMHAWFTATLDDHDKLKTMQYVMVIHDIGKSGQVFEQMGVDQKSVDHDQVIISLLNDPRYRQQRQVLLPTFGKLSAEGQKITTDVLSVSLNFGQFLQAEAPAAALDGLSEDLDATTRNMYVMHAILDIAGVTGHINQDSSIVLNSPTYVSMAKAKAALSNSDLHNSTDRYNAYLDYRTAQFGVITDIESQQQLMDIRAKVRLGCMLRYSSPGQFLPLSEGYDSLTEQIKSVLSEELNRNGINDRATLPYYGPALLKSLTEKVDIETSLVYFAHILNEAAVADKSAREAGITGVVTAELGDLTRAFNQGRLDITNAVIHFNRHGDTLVPEVVDQLS